MFLLYLRGLKGVGGKVIILEEASRLDQAVFQEVVVPLLGVRDTALIGISTPLDENNFYSELVQSKKPDGEPLFNVVTIRLLCDVCEKAGVMHCPHNADVPPWKSSERQVCDMIYYVKGASPYLTKRWLVRRNWWSIL